MMSFNPFFPFIFFPNVGRYVGISALTLLQWLKLWNNQLTSLHYELMEPVLDTLIHLDIHSECLHVSTCHNMSAHVSTCHNKSAHTSTYQHMSAHVSTCQHMSANAVHVSTWQHMQYMSAHVSTCQHMPAHVSTCHNM